MKLSTVSSSVAGAAVIALHAAGAAAADLPRAPAPSSPPAPLEAQWEFSVAAYVWAAGRKGTFGTLPPLPPVYVDASFNDILKNLDGALMGAFEARRGPLIFLTDVIAMRLGPGAQRSRGPITASVSVDSISFTGIAAAGYRVVDGSNFTFDLFAGARLSYVDTALTALINVAGVQKGASLQDARSWVDAAVGMRARYAFDENWFASLIAFAGGGASKYQWDIFGGVGYAFNRSWTAFAGYRAMKGDYRDGDFILDVLQNGPLVGLQYRW